MEKVVLVSLLCGFGLGVAVTVFLILVQENFLFDIFEVQRCLFVQTVKLLTIISELTVGNVEEKQLELPVHKKLLDKFEV